MSLRGIVFGVLCGLLVGGTCVGCGDDADGGSPPGGAGSGPTIDQLPQALAQTICGTSIQCLGPAATLFLRGEDCVTIYAKGAISGDLAAASRLVAEGKLTYDPAKAQGCLDAYRALSCTELDNPQPAVCQQVFGGKAAVGEACTISAECGAGLYCEPGDACPGKCAEHHASGTACTFTEQCVAGFHCGNKGTCVTRVGAAAACGDDVECEIGMLCLGTDDAKKANTGTCAAVNQAFSAPVGSACDANAGPLCATGSVCELQGIQGTTASFQCAQAYGSGKPCKVAIPDGCPDGEYCPTDLTAKPPVLEATCTRRPAVGEPCGKSVIAQDVCAPYAVCRTEGEKKTCVAKQDVGGACQSNGECYSELCKGGACAEKVSCEPR